MTSKFTEEVRAKILQALRDGCNREGAARSAGITGRTLRRWMADKEDPECVALREAVIEAEGASVAGLVQTIKKASEKQWQAAAWLLERRYPDTWGSDRQRWRDIRDELKKTNARLDEFDNFDQAQRRLELDRDILKSRERSATDWYHRLEEKEARLAEREAELERRERGANDVAPSHGNP